MMRVHLGWIAVLLVLVHGGPALAQTAEPVAVLTEVKKGGSDGEIRVKLLGKDEWRAPQPLMSLPRFVAVLFPLAIWLAAWMTGRVVRERLVLGAFAAALVVYTGIFATWHWVA